MKENIKATINKDKANKYSLMVILTTEYINWINSMEKVSINGKMDQYTTVNLIMVLDKVMDNGVQA